MRFFWKYVCVCVCVVLNRKHFFFAGLLSTSASVQGFACPRKLEGLCFWDVVVVVSRFWHIKLLVGAIIKKLMTQLTSTYSICDL